MLLKYANKASLQQIITSSRQSPESCIVFAQRQPKLLDIQFPRAQHRITNAAIKPWDESHFQM